MSLKKKTILILALVVILVISVFFLFSCSRNDEHSFSLEINPDEIYRIEGFWNWRPHEITSRSRIQTIVRHLNSYSLCDKNRGSWIISGETPDIYLRLLDAEGNALWYLGIHGGGCEIYGGGGIIRGLETTGPNRVGMYRITNEWSSVWWFNLRF